MDDKFKETLYTIDKSGRRKWVYPQLVKGFFFYRRAIVAYALILVYLAMPWIKIGGKQGMLIDITSRQFVFFGTTLWATDTIFLVMFLLIMGLSLFFFTSLFGRVWCGWACPETVFLEFVFRPIERLIEGGPVQRKKLDEQPWSLSKLYKKLLKHGISAALAWVLASTALAYFVGREPLLNMMQHPPSENLNLFLLTLVLMGVMGFQFGWFREQFCTVLCPYARFQSVLMDRNSLTIGYDVLRGEPRGKASKKNEGEELGDCIDCGLCVRVCPTGIDIRNGLQLECINCAGCIDACDSIMKNLGRAPGLIRYDTEARLLQGEKRSFSPRTFVYGTIIAVVAAVLIYKINHRSLIDFQVLRGATDKPFSQINENLVVNHLHVHLTNKGEEAERFEFEVDDRNVQAVTPVSPFVVDAGKMETVPLFLNFAPKVLTLGKKKIVIFLKSDGSVIAKQEFTILGPNG